ncbi:hypothetical protein ACLB2K_040232 [Fragaria x ananassa]
MVLVLVITTDYKQLEITGRAIAEKCGGVPLVAKVLGSLLDSRASKVEWLSIRDNRLWELPEGEDRIMKVPEIIFSKFKAMRVLSLDTADIKELPNSFVSTDRAELPRSSGGLARLGPFGEDLDSFPDFLVPSHELVSLRLNGWPKLKSLPQQVQHLASLTSLTTASFNGVETLPEWLGNLASLVALSIYWCDNLKCLPSLEAMQRLTKLQHLAVYGCPLLKERFTMDSGEEWPKISHIPHIK